MGNNEQKRWVVLIQRKPRGPLTELEVQALLGKGLIRTNDLGFEVSTTGGASDWKMLWQFPEFDRRAIAAEKRRLQGLPPEPPFPERRAPPTETQIKQQVKLALPEELLHIAPEDLIPHNTSGPASVSKAANSKLDLDVVETPSPRSGDGGSIKGRLYAGVLGIIVFGVILSQWKSTETPRSRVGETSTTNAPASESKIQNRQLPGGERRLTSSPGRSGVPIAPPPSPREDNGNRSRDRDTGTISPEQARDREYGRDDKDDDDGAAEDLAFESGKPRKRLKKIPLKGDDADQDEDPRGPATSDDSSAEGGGDSDRPAAAEADYE